MHTVLVYFQVLNMDLSHRFCLPPFFLFLLGGGRKGGTNTAIPHMVAREYRNTASKFSQIPKPQLQMGKVDIVNTTNPPFKYKQYFYVSVSKSWCVDVKRTINIRLSQSFNIVPYMYAFT